MKGKIMHILENEFVKIEVSPVGAELQSLYSKKTQTEYLWQPGHDVWNHHSMLLFPNPGRIAGDRSIIGGKIYPATMHGFANDMTFAVADTGENHICMELRDSSATRRYFPYAFRLQVAFTLEKDTVKQTFRVINEDDKTVFFSLGAHPGFYCPIDLSDHAEDYALEFDTPQRIGEFALQENTRLRTGEKTAFLDGGREVALHDHFFDRGPYLLDGVRAKTVTLRSRKSGRFVEMGIEGFPYLCLWGVPTRLSLVCIEPWCGTSDRVDTDHVWETREGIESVEVGKIFERTITFRMG